MCTYAFLFALITLRFHLRTGPRAHLRRMCNANKVIKYDTASTSGDDDDDDDDEWCAIPKPLVHDTTPSVS